MNLKEIQDAIEVKYAHNDEYCEMFDDIYNKIFELSDEESERLTVKEFLLNLMKEDKKNV